MKFRKNLPLWMRACGRIISYSGKRYASDQLAQQAVVLTYYTLFSVVPLAALLFGIAKGFGLERHLLDAIYARFPDQHELVNYICEFAEKTLLQSSGGVVAGVGVIALFWTVIWLINNIEKAFNVVWGLPPRRDVFRKFSSYLSLVLITPIMMVLISTLGVMIRRWLNFLSDKMPDWSFAGYVLDKAADIAPMLISCGLFFLIYLLVPNTRVRWKGACVAGIISGVCFQLLQDSFIFLQSSVFSYNRIYGSFAILPLFLVWVNWSWQIILIGAEISFVHQHWKSGVFNENSRKLNLKLRCEYQLAILSLIFREFEKGNGPVPETEVALKLRLPDVILRKEIGELIFHGLLCRTTGVNGEMNLLPGVPAGNFKIMDYIRVIFGIGEEENPDIAKFDRLFKEVEKVVSESKYNINIHEV